MTESKTTNHSHLWNDLPFEERKRLMPYQIQNHILHLEQAREFAVRSHKRHMKELEDWIANCRESLAKELADV